MQHEPVSVVDQPDWSRQPVFDRYSTRRGDFTVDGLETEFFVAAVGWQPRRLGWLSRSG
jgi:hypothetical protein